MYNLIIATGPHNLCEIHAGKELFLRPGKDTGFIVLGNSIWELI